MSPIDQSLLEHTGWTRALAARLVADPHLADELSQDTLLAALEKPPRRGGDLRRWLGTVMGNLLRQGHRQRARRAERERHRARAEAQPGVLETLERACAHQKLVDALLQLEEPFRTALVLRFFEGLPPREVARRLGVPVNTVRSRLRRGLCRMRSSLDRDEADRRALGTLLQGAVLTGISIMSLKTKLILTAAAVLAGVLWTQWPTASPRGELPPSGEPAAMPMAGDPAKDAGRSPRPLERRAVSGVGEQPALASVQGRVVDTQGSPLSGVGVAFHLAVGVSGPIGAVSDLDGGFELAVPRQNGTILVDEPGYVTLLAGSYRPGGQIAPVVVAARTRALDAVVLDDEGRPLPGARSQVHMPASFATRFTQVLDASRERPVWALSDEAGRVSMPQVPVVDGAELLTSRYGFETDRTALTSPGDEVLRIVLREDVATGSLLQGVVLDREGAAAPGAYVALDELTTRTGDDGTFRFDLADAPGATRLQALSRGSLPAGLSRLGGEPWPEFVTLRLGGPTEVLAGRVVDPSGTPQEGVVVWVSDPTRFGKLGALPVQVENLLAGSRTRDELETWARAQPQGFDRAAFLDRTPTAFWTWTETDDLGRFRLEGLLPRRYRISALRRQTLEMIETGPVEAGTLDVRIEFDRQDVHEHVAGRVLARDGRPLQGVDVTYSRQVFRVRNEGDPPGRYAAVHDMSIDPVRTDAQGSFHLRAVPVGLDLLFYGDAILATYRGLEQGSEHGNLEVVVPSRVHLRVELSEPDRADSFAILDAAGRAIGLQLIRVGRRQVMLRGEITGGRSQILATGDGTFTLALYLGEDEVERHPVLLRPGETNVLRY